MIVLKISVRQMFPQEAQAYIEQLEESDAVSKMKLQDLDKIHKKLNKSEMVDDDQQTKRKFKLLIEESHDLEYHERQNFFNGVYSQSFQKLIVKAATQNLQKRHQDVLKFLA